MSEPTRNRHSLRLKDYDYALPGAYFVTLVTQRREPVLGALLNGEAILSNQGLIVQRAWYNLPRHFAHVRLDEFVIMPNHVHGIIMIVDSTRRGDASGKLRAGSPVTQFPDASPLPHGTQPGSLGAIIQNFKSMSTRRINGMQNTPGQSFWQRNYYEHIIRNETELQKIRQYIRDNPLQWDLDEENTVGC